ncbi:AAA family ATPase [Natronoflexus pectinivorans]|uniref:Exonuclease SbcC n=1 Tax=Natronoflexus pectinivorans TaxID=682526 RepID=A0A4R2GHL7_9BACT|nr:AAA family ATPase [Natronoflexus pectinivorans]TCO07724.1 exonuclease SbcC [Natronoflexus pectinivorans]
MIPHKLNLQGLYSYINKQSIDFDNLTRDGLFGIFGSVGSGKSSVLEAISFALYGNTERLNSRDNRAYNMMNLRSDKMFLEFEFSNGENRRFLCRVEGKRNSKKFEDVGKLNRTCYEMAENGEWIPIDTPVEEITGLSYDNFRRTVIIPQGKFQEFLQLGPKERTAMMQELFHLHRYDLYAGVAELHNKSVKVLDGLDGQLKTLGEIKPEQIEELTVQLEKLKGESVTLEKELKDVQDKLTALKRLQELKVKQENAQKFLSQLVEKEKDVDNQEKELNLYEKSVRLFKSLLDASHRLKNDVLGNEKYLKDALLEHEKLKKQLEEASVQFQKTKIEYEKRDLMKREADEIKKLSEVLTFRQTIGELIKRRQKGEQMLKEKRAVQTDIREMIQGASVKLTIEKAQLPDFAVLMEIKEWYRHREQLNKDAASLLKQQQEHNQQSEDFESKLQKHVRELGLSMPDGMETLSFCKELLKQAELQTAKFEEQLKEIEQNRVRLKVQNELQGFAVELKDGKPCPLCGSEHHPDLLKPENVHEELTALSQHTDVIQKGRQNIAMLEKHILKIQAELSSYWNEKTRNEKEISANKQETEAHLKTFRWEGHRPDSSEKLTRELEKHKTLTVAINAGEKMLDQLRRNLEDAEKDLKKYEELLTTLGNELTAKESRVETLLADIRHLNMEDFREAGAQELIDKSSELVKMADAIEIRYQKEEEHVNGLTRKQSELTGKVSELQKAGLQLRDSLTKNELKIDDLLRENDELNREKLLAILASEPDVDKIRKEIEEYRNLLAAKRSEVKQLEADLQGQKFDPVEWEALNKRNETLSDNFKKLNIESGQLAEKKKRLETDYLKYKELTKTREEAELRAADLSDLRNLFKGSGFVNYISTVYLQELCKAANDRFYKLTRQQLSLELGDDNMFYIRDFLNEGRVRSVKTLSGGQTFQAALSLALALADSIQKHTSEHGNFFFLDEGFGTLDKDSLRVVFDTLKSLRHENRIVGVISHVEEMQQEITTFLKVVNEEKTGSQVTASWEIS